HRALGARRQGPHDRGGDSDRRRHGPIAQPRALLRRRGLSGPHTRVTEPYGQVSAASRCDDALAGDKACSGAKAREPAPFRKYKNAYSVPVRGAGSPVASSTAARHSRLIGRIGGTGTTSGCAVATTIGLMFSVRHPLRMKRL